MAYPTTHGARQLLRQLETNAPNIDPAKLVLLGEMVRELAADDGGLRRQSNRRKRVTRRLAMLEVILDTLDAYIIEHGPLSATGEPLPCFKLYGWLTNASGRLHKLLGLERRQRPERSLQDYLRQRNPTTTTSIPQNGAAPASDAGNATTTKEEE